MVGMFEHAGKWNYTEFVGKLCGLPKDEGVALVCSIGYLGAPKPNSLFQSKVYFSSCRRAAASEVPAAAERSGLIVTEVETLREWRMTQPGFRKSSFAACVIS